MDIIIKIEDDQVEKLVSQTFKDYGEMYFADTMKEAVEKYIGFELEAAFQCINGTYSGTAVKASDKNIATSFIRSLFITTKKDSWSNTYQPTEYMQEIIRSLDVKDILDKYKDELIKTMHENIDTYMATFIRNMFISNIFMDRSFQESLQQQIDMYIQHRFNVERNK